MLEQVLNSPILYSLSLTLVHFLWQGLLVGLLLKSALLIIDKSKSKLRYTLATFAMLANAMLAIFTFVMVYPELGFGTDHNLTPIPLTHLVHELTQQNLSFTYQEFIPSILAYSLPYISILWLVTITILASKLLIEIRNVNNLPLNGSVSPNAALLARFDELAKQIKLPKTPRLLISLKIEVPMAIGWLKPVVLLPASMVTGLSSEQLEMLILHELAHIRRHDYLVNFLQTLIELLFFFHPSVHWIGKQMRNEREYCSDDIAVQHCGDAIAYAHTLTDTASLCAKKHFHTIPTMAMAASGGDLKARVLRLVDHHCAPTNSASKWFAAISLLLALTLLGLNQLLTMPVAQHLNNSFPWQENNSLNRNSLNEESLNSTANYSHVRYLGSEDDFTELSENSIAMHLLRSQNNNRQSLFVESIGRDNDNIANQGASNNLVLTRPLVSALPLVSPTKSPSTLAVKVIKTDTLETAFVKMSKTNKADNVTTNKTKVNNTKANSIIHKELNKTASTSGLLANTDYDSPANTEATKTKSSENEQVTSQISQNNSLHSKVALAATSSKVLDAQAAHDIEQSKAEIATLTLANDDGVINDETTNNRLQDKQFANTDVQAPVKSINKTKSKNSLYDTSSTSKSANRSLTNDSNILLAKQVKLKTTDAKLLDSTSPVYPTLAKRRGIEMEVQVNFTIDRNGKVKDINFGEQGKITYFKSAIRSAIRKWRFAPAIRDNDIIESKMSKIFSFSLQS